MTTAPRDAASGSVGRRLQLCDVCARLAPFDGGAASTAAQSRPCDKRRNERAVVYSQHQAQQLISRIGCCHSLACLCGRILAGNKKDPTCSVNNFYHGVAFAPWASTTNIFGIQVRLQ